MLFYAAFALARLPTRHRLPALTTALLTLGAAGAVLRPINAIASAYASPLLAEFIAGAWLCWAWQRGVLLQGRAALALLVAGLVALAMRFRFADPGQARLLLYGLPALCIVAGALGLEVSGYLPRVPGLHALGDASYALYLTHLLVLHYAKPALPRLINIAEGRPAVW